MTISLGWAFYATIAFYAVIALIGFTAIANAFYPKGTDNASDNEIVIRVETAD